MSLIVLDDVCPLCSRGFADGEDAYSAWGLFTTDRDWAGYCTRAMHWDCYLGWDRRPQFAAMASAAWRRHVADSRDHQRVVMENPAVHVSVRLQPGGRGEVVLFFAELGADLRVDLCDWDDWLRFRPVGVHPAVAAAWLQVRSPVRAVLPSRAMILGNYPPKPETKSDDAEFLADADVYSGTVKEDRWKELLALQREGLEKSYFRRLIEFVSCYPDDGEAAERLRDGRPWIDKFLFEPRKLHAAREAGFLWVLLGGWPKPTDAGVRSAAKAYCEKVAADFADTRAAGYARKLAGKWGL